MTVLSGAELIRHWRIVMSPPVYAPLTGYHEYPSDEMPTRRRRSMRTCAGAGQSGISRTARFPRL